MTDALKKFLNKYTTIPNLFLEDFINLNNVKNISPIINFDLICKWLEIPKYDLKKTLIKNFEKDYDYILNTIISPSHKEEILLTSNCFKELCMLSRSKKSKLVRKYFIEMERFIS